MPRSRESFLDRYGQLEHLKLPGPTKVSFVHNHKLLRASKIYLNVYHLWPKWVNGVLSACGLSGGFHSAVEVCGKEYQFRGCSNINEGIFETHPAHSLPARVAALGTGCLSPAEKEIYSEVGRMKEHIFLGLWSGSHVDFDLLMCHMRDRGGWKGPNYKMLTFNCNHFVLEVCEHLLTHNSFHPARGMTSKEKMVPKSLFRLTVAVNRVCVSSVTRGLDEDIIPPASGQVFAFRGRPYKVGVSGDKHRPKLSSRILKQSLAGMGIGSSRQVPSTLSSSVVSSNTTVDIATSSGTASNQKITRSLGQRREGRHTAQMRAHFGVHTEPSGLRQLDLFKRGGERDRDRQVHTTSSSSYCNTTGTDDSLGNLGKQPKSAAMGEITEEASPVYSQASSLGYRKLSRTPSRVSLRQESVPEGPTRLVGYKSIDDVRWLNEVDQHASAPNGGSGNSSDRPYSAKSTCSSRSKPPSLGIGVELRAKHSQDCTEDDAFETRQPSSMDREIDVSMLGVQMTHRFMSHMTSSSESLTAPNEMDTSRNGSSGKSSPFKVTPRQLNSLPQIIGNPTFLNSGEVTPDDMRGVGYRGGQRVIYSDQTPAFETSDRPNLREAPSFQR